MVVLMAVEVGSVCQMCSVMYSSYFAMFHVCSCDVCYRLALDYIKLFET